MLTTIFNWYLFAVGVTALALWAHLTYWKAELGLTYKSLFDPITVLAAVTAVLIPPIGWSVLYVGIRQYIQKKAKDR